MNQRKNDVKIALQKLATQGPDSNFEASFANIAHAFLQDKAPNLLKYELGFQLLDRNEDNTRAVGVFAFRVGAQIMYAPQFFLNGDLKGHELLYLKNQDMFVPISEAWLNHLLNKNNPTIGEPHEGSSEEGIFKNPNLRPLFKSPMKMAAAFAKVAGYAKDFIPKYAELVDADIDQACNDFADVLGDTLSLDRLLKQANEPMLKKAFEMLSINSQTLSAANKWYSLGAMRDLMVKQAAIREADADTLLARNGLLDINGRIVKKAAAPDNFTGYGGILENDAEDDVTIYESRYELPEGLSATELQVFFNRGVLVRDKRKPAELSQVYDEKQDIQFTSPEESGIYSVLEASGNLTDKMILTNVRDMRNSQPRAFVIDVGAKSVSESQMFPQQTLMVVSSGADASIGFRKWYDSLSDASDLETGKTYVFVSENGTVTNRIRIDRRLGTDSHGVTTYSIIAPGMDSYSSVSPFEYDRDTKADFPGTSGLLLVGASVGRKITSHGGRIFVPAKAKKVPYEHNYGEEDKFVPGDVNDMRRRLLQITQPVSLSATRDEDSYKFKDEMGELKKQAALKKLMVQYGLGESDAWALLKEAKARCGSTVSRLIKKANSPYLSAIGLPATPPMPEGINEGNILGFNGNVGERFDVERPVASMASSNYPKQGYMYSYNEMERQLKTHIQDAAASGKKDVFDVGMLSSMLLVASDDRIIDQWVPDLVKGMDRAGRLLFLFYWHYDKFEDRFGQQDLPELEEFLRTAFDILGKVILFLKNKDLENSPTDGGYDVGLRGE